MGQRGRRGCLRGGGLLGGALLDRALFGGLALGLLAGGFLLLDQAPGGVCLGRLLLGRAGLLGLGAGFGFAAHAFGLGGAQPDVDPDALELPAGLEKFLGR